MSTSTVCYDKLCRRRSQITSDPPSGYGQLASEHTVCQDVPQLPAHRRVGVLKKHLKSFAQEVLGLPAVRCYTILGTSSAAGGEPPAGAALIAQRITLALPEGELRGRSRQLAEIGLADISETMLGIDEVVA